MPSLGVSLFGNLFAILLSLVFVVVIGFMVAIVCGYFSGLVGVSASPGSSILIAVLILAALLIRTLFEFTGHSSNATTLLGEAITIIIASVLMQIACIANDTMQDLKVGQLIGTSPRKQQFMLILGAFVASLIVPLVMEVLYQAHGIAGAMPRPGMNPAESMSAPPAAIMAALTGAFFTGAVPLKFLSIGAAAIVATMLLQHFILKRFKLEVSYIGVGIGMYLSLSNSIALVIGALLSYVVAKRIKTPQGLQQKTLLACGMVAGASLMDVLLAVPIAINPTGAGLSFAAPTTLVSVISVISLIVLVQLYVRRGK